MSTKEDYEAAAKRFIDGIVSESEDARNLMFLLGNADGTLAEWREADPTEAAEADRLADRLGFDLPNSDDFVWQAHEALQIFLDETAGYGADVNRKVTIILAGGGPSGWIDFVVDRDGNLIESSVSYNDWFRTPVTRFLDAAEATAAYDRYRVDILIDTL